MQAFSVQTSLSTAHVACLRIFPGILPEMVRGVLRLKDLRGLVLETFGAGNAPEDDELIGVLEEGVKRGVVIVNVTQCQVGTVSPLYASATALAKAGVVFGLDMTSEGDFPPLCISFPLRKEKKIIHFRLPDRLFFFSCFSRLFRFPLIASRGCFTFLPYFRELIAIFIAFFSSVMATLFTGKCLTERHSRGETLICSGD